MTAGNTFSRNLLILLSFFTAALLLTPAIPVNQGQYSLAGDGDEDQPRTLAEPGTRAVTGYSPADDEVEYAIITTNAMSSAVRPLAEWKTRTGTAAKVFTVESIIAQYSGPDTQAKIREKLIDLDSSGADLEWALLVGDSGDIPARKLYSNSQIYSLDEYYWSDIYYAGLDGTWNKDGDSKYGEPGEEDWDYEVYVGRIPADTATEADRAVQCIIDYESDPAAGDWIKTMSLWGGLMDAPNDPGYDPDQDNAYEIQQRVKPFIPGHITVKELYDYPYTTGGDYTSSVDGLYQSKAVADLTAGRSLINFAGQAYYGGNALIDYADPTGKGDIHTSSAWDPLFEHTDAAAAGNGDMLSFVYMSGCDAAVFVEADDTNQEKLLTASGGGAIGLISSTGKTFRGEEDGGSAGNWWMNEEFWKQFFAGTSSRPGETLYDVKEKFYDSVIRHHNWPEAPTANTFGYVLLGDPEVDIWTDTPGTMLVDVPELWSGGGEFTFTVTDELTGDPVHGAVVTVWNAGTYAHGETGADGRTTFNVDADGTGDAMVTVTAHNYLPEEVQTGIVTEPPDLELGPGDIHAAPPVQWDVGTTLSADVHNAGGEDSGDILFSVSFWDGDPDGSGRKIGDDQLSSIASGSTKTAQVAWVPGEREHEIWVVLDPADLLPESHEDNNRAPALIVVNLSDLEVSPEAIFIGTGPPVVGEVLSLNVTIHNTGDVTATDVWTGLYSSDTFSSADRLGPKAHAGTIAPGGTGYAAFEVTVGNDTAELHVLVDPDNTTLEYSRSNNHAYIVIVPDHPPVFSQESFHLSLTEDTPSEDVINLHAILSDADDRLADLTIWTSGGIPEEVNVSIDDEWRLDIYPGSDWFGHFSFRLNAADRAVTANATVEVTVQPVNDPPALAWIGDTGGALTLTEDAPFSLALEASDPDGDELTFLDNTSLFEVHFGTGEISFTPDDAAVGTHLVSLLVSDGELFATQTVTFEVGNVQDLPVLSSIPDAEVALGETFTWVVNATDDDIGDTLTFSDNSQVLDIDGSTGVISYTPVKGDGGVHRITVTVSDGHNDVSTVFNLTVTGDDSKDDHDDDDDDSDGGVLEGFPGGGTGLAALIAVIASLIIIMAMLAVKRRRKQALQAGELWSGEKEDSPSIHPTAGQEPEARFSEDDLYPVRPPDEVTGAGGKDPLPSGETTAGVLPGDELPALPPGKEGTQANGKETSSGPKPRRRVRSIEEKP